jgi:hypothetical protein
MTIYSEPMKTGKTQKKAETEKKLQKRGQTQKARKPRKTLKRIVVIVLIGNTEGELNTKLEKISHKIAKEGALSGEENRKHGYSFRVTDLL